MDLEEYNPEQSPYAVKVNNPHGVIILDFQDEEAMRLWTNAFVVHKCFMEDVFSGGGR